MEITGKEETLYTDLLAKKKESGGKKERTGVRQLSELQVAIPNPPRDCTRCATERIFQ